MNKALSENFGSGRCRSNNSPVPVLPSRINYEKIRNGQNPYQKSARRIQAKKNNLLNGQNKKYLEYNSP